MEGNDFVHKAIVTGATSMIGLATIAACLEKNVQVTAIVREYSCRVDQLPNSSSLEIVFCDLDHLASYVPINRDADVFFHFAWASTSKADGRFDPTAQEPNIRYTLDAVHLAKRFGCQKFIGAGSQAEYGLSESKLTKDTPARPVTAYGTAKYAAGHLAAILCESLGMDFVWGRIFSVYGPHDREDTMIYYILKKLLDGKSPKLTACEQIWDYLYEDDAGSAFYALGASEKASGVYCIGSGQGRPLKEYVEEIRSFMGSEIELMFGEIPYSKHQIMHLEADISKIVEDTGWIPRTSFRSGIRNMLDRMNVVNGYE